MPDRNEERDQTHRSEGADFRRRQLRTLLLTAADAARQSRRGLSVLTGHAAGQAVRDRVAKLLSAAS